MTRSKNGDGGLAEQAYALIRDRILRGQLPFGAPVSRRQLSQELGMSTLPVSEALMRLRNELLIEAVPRVGTMVRVPTRQDVIGFYVVREALESQAARLFAEKAHPTERRDLIEAARRLDDAYKECAASANATEQQLYELRNLHMQFHLRVAAGARCPFLHEAIEKNQILIFNWFFDRLFGYPGLPDTWHGELAAVLAEYDVDAADRAMRRHVRFRMDELLVRLEPYFSLNGKQLADVLHERPAPRRTAKRTVKVSR
jgi:DNA-binding GntR family transcriptional regulator